MQHTDNADVQSGRRKAEAVRDAFKQAEINYRSIAPASDSTDLH
jgi:hypothetical protein